MSAANRSLQLEPIFHDVAVTIRQAVDAIARGGDPMLQMMVGFSMGMSLLLAAAFATGCRNAPLPWQARLAGFVMLAGLAPTQREHFGMIAHCASRRSRPASTRLPTPQFPH